MAAVASRTLAGREADEFGPLARQLSERSTITVKNTFIEAYLIDDEDSGDEGSEIPMVAVRSCPAVRMLSSVSTAASVSSAENSPAAAAVAVSAARRVCWADACDEAPPATARAALAALPPPLPEANRQPQASVGSMLHGTGECKPCAWFWRPQGCDNGLECRHCHLCGQGELKARRKARASAARRAPRRGPGGVAFE